MPSVGLGGLVLFLLSVSIISAQQIAFTWDDVPAHSALPAGQTRVGIARAIISAMKDAHMPPVFGFVNGVLTEREPLSVPVLSDWRHAGLPLGNHTWSHMNLNTSSLGGWEADVLRNEAILQCYMDTQDWHWLHFRVAAIRPRYPGAGNAATQSAATGSTETGKRDLPLNT